MDPVGDAVELGTVDPVGDAVELGTVDPVGDAVELGTVGPVGDAVELGTVGPVGDAVELGTVAVGGGALFCFGFVMAVPRSRPFSFIVCCCLLPACFGCSNKVDLNKTKPDRINPKITHAALGIVGNPRQSSPSAISTSPTTNAIEAIGVVSIEIGLWYGALFYCKLDYKT